MSYPIDPQLVDTAVDQGEVVHPPPAVADRAGRRGRAAGHIPALETEYAGCRFRSRLEARWALAFDHLSIPWEYEPDGYLIGGGNGGRPRKYLPDFYLPRTNTWVEVKATDELLDKPLMVCCVDDWSACGDDEDGAGPLPGLSESSSTKSAGLLLLGPIPRPTPQWIKAFTLLGHRKGVQHDVAVIGPASGGAGRLWEFARVLPQDCYMDVTIGSGKKILNGCQHEWINDRGFRTEADPTADRVADRANAAFTAARSARFGT